MMKKLLCMSLLATGAMLYATADPLKPENWNKQFSTSGKALKIVHAEKENAVRFLASFPDSVKDRWLYPAIALSPEDRDADTLHFEIRAVQNPAGRGYKNTLVIFLDTKGKQLGGITFPAPQEEYSQVTLKLDGRLKFPLSDAASIRIGLNNRDAQEVAMFLRNIRFGKKAPAR